METFIESQVESWTDAQEEIEKQFLYCEELDFEVRPPPKKRGRKMAKCSSIVPQENNAMLELAASLRIDYIKKVGYTRIKWV